MATRRRDPATGHRAGIITLAVMQALLSFTSEARFLRYANKHLRQMFPVLPGQSGYNERLRKLAHTMAWLIGVLATQVSVVTDQVWLVDSTPVECGRSRETVKRSDLRGYAEYGYCASHTRYFLGFRLHLIATVHGIPRAGVPQTTAPDHRVHLRHPQRTTRPRTPRRPHPRRRQRPHQPTPPRPDHSDLAQRPHRSTRPTVPDRLRPLRPHVMLGITHLVAAGMLYLPRVSHRRQGVALHAHAPP
jgi:hypothetical protein